MEDNTPKRENEKSELFVNNIRFWQILAIVLVLIIVILIVIRKNIIISKELITLFAIAGAVFLVYQYILKQKETLNFYKIAEKISDEHFNATGERLDVTTIKGTPISNDEVLIEFPFNSKVFQFDTLQGVRGIDIDTLAGVKKDLETSAVTKRYFDSRESENAIRRKLEELGALE